MSGFGLIAHIGLPKTATTSLQYYLSKRHGYIGRGANSYKYTQELLRIFYRYSKGKDVDHELRQWVDTVSAWYTLEGVSGPVIISEEFFFGGGFNNNPEFPLATKPWKGKVEPVLAIARFLAKLQAFKHLGVDSVGCILTIRSQPEWLGSKYAQDSAKLISPSQQDFEKRLHEFFLLEDLSWCDWSRWVRDLDNFIGKQNVHVLCMEEIGGDAFWRRVDELCGAAPEDVSGGESISAAIPHLNNKRGRCGEWLLSDFKPGSALAKTLRWPAGSLRKKVMVLAGNATRRLGAKRLYRRGDRIFLSDSLVSKVSEVCGPGNDWLSDRLHKKLSDLHYPVSRRE